MIYHLQRRQRIACPLDKVFSFFADARNLEALTPPWLNFRILTPGPIEMKAGAEILYQISWHFLRMRWKTEIVEWQPNRFFVDVQARGPYRSWHHTHSFAADGEGTLITDTVKYEMPFGIAGRLAHRLRVRRDLERIFDYRAAQVAASFAAGARP